MKKLLVSFGLIFCLTACTPAPPPSDPDAPSDWYTVYFSDPTSPTANTLAGGPDTALAAAIDQARVSVEVAAYDLSLWSIRDALIDAHRRGVNVRLVAESANFERPEMGELDEAGIPIIGDGGNALMHNKFVVIDRFEVWTGSMNFTVTGAYRNDNNLIRLRSSRLAENYLVEFEEMFTSGLFGTSSPANTPNPIITVQATQVEVYFSPDDQPEARIIELINQAQQSVFFLAFAFTSDPISEAVLNAHNRGLTVRGVFDAGQSSQQGAEFSNLANAGVEVELDGNPAKMHHKVFIIDSQIVILGSYNFSRSAAERNDENLVILHNIDIANSFLDEFSRIFALGE